MTTARARGHGAWLAAILLLATVLRLIRLGTFPFWQDEVHNLLKAEHIVGVLTKGTLISNHPPLFAVLVTGWRAIGMDASEWTMRMLPALLGVLIVGMTYVAASRMVNRRAGLISAFLVAVSPFFLVHSQDLKVYIVLPLVATILAWVLFEATTRNTFGWWSAYAVAAGAACYSDVFALPLLIGLNIWFLLQIRGRMNRLPGWIIGNLVGAVLFLPFLGILLRRANIALIQPVVWWIPQPTPLHVVFFLKTIAFGYSDVEPFFKIALVLFVGAAAFGACVAFLHGWRVATLLLCWFALPVAAVYIGSQFTNSFFLLRGLLPFAIPFYILMGTGFARIEPRPLRAVVIALFGAIAIVPIWKHYTRDLPLHEIPHRPGIHFPVESNRAAEYLIANFQEGDVIVHTSPSMWFPFFWYGMREFPQFQVAVDPEHIAIINTLAPGTTGSGEYAGYFPHEIADVTLDARRVWMVFTEWEREHLPGNPMQVWRWLNANYRERQTVQFTGLEIRLYEMMDNPRGALSRDNDDGISADFRWNVDEAPYRITVPDSGVIERSADDRRGALRLSFDAEPRGDMRSVARTPDRRIVSFTLVNTTDESAHVQIDALANDMLIAAATFARENPQGVVWRTVPQHNPSGPPVDFELTGAAAHFKDPGTAVLTNTVPIPAGTYDTRFYMIATPDDSEHLRASVDVFIDNANVLERAPKNRPDLYGWRWVHGAPTTVSNDPTTIRIVANHLLGYPKSYADVAYLAMLRQRGAPRASQPEPFEEPWPGAITMAPRERKSWALEIDADTARVDVWVYEFGRDGRAYYIYDVRPEIDAAVP